MINPFGIRWMRPPTKSLYSVEFIVYGDPQAQHRPRTRRGQARPYSGEVNLVNSQCIQDAFQSVVDIKPPVLIELPSDRMAHLIIVCILPPTKTSSDGTSKPDLDNVLKLVKDALKGHAWTDDRLVVGQHLEKWCGEETYMHVYINYLEGRH